VSGKPVVCPECRQLSIFKDDGKHRYSFKAFPEKTEDLRGEFTHNDKILISEYHGDHYFVILLDKESADDNIQIEGKVASTFNLHVKTIVQKITEKSSLDKYGVLIISDQSIWGQLINIVYASLLQSDSVQVSNSKLMTSNLRSKLEFENLKISHNSNEENGETKYNAVIVDQKNLIDDDNINDLLDKLVIQGSIVVTVNSRVEDPIPKISMKEFSEALKKSKLNFLFVDIQDIQQAAILLTQVLQK
jgi:uncharacterized protein (UPF0212 family)